MHASSLENMRKCYQRYVAGRGTPDDRPVKVLDVGGADVNGSYADIFKKPTFDYTGTDLQAGPGVTIVLDDPYVLPVDDAAFDIVLSGQMLEHCEFFWKAFDEMVRVVKPEGFIFLIAPSAGPIHQYPVDCYRFYPDAYKALARHSDCHLIDWWQDPRGPWKDLVGVFSKTRYAQNRTARVGLEQVVRTNCFAQDSDTFLDLIQGEVSYLNVLKQLHDTFEPATYLEIGVRRGRSLSLACGAAVGVDPDPDISCALPSSTDLVRQTSDDFFEDGIHPILKSKPELVFIDGMHLFENVLRDFMHVEKIAGPHTIVVIDDVLPNLPEQATRERLTRVWTGDVWKIYQCLARHRPDLQLLLLDTSPTGLLIITGLNPANPILWERYNPIVREFLSTEAAPAESVLQRQEAASPSGQPFRNFLSLLKTAKAESRDFQLCRYNVTDGVNCSPIAKSTGSDKPKLSVIVAAYNMHRELPRTLRSLSPLMQKGIAERDYEIIVVDNGSTRPFDREACTTISPNIKFLYEPPGNVSPVAALNRAVRVAQGDLIGVMIDGARMASPGLLANALKASNLSDKAVIGSLSFHLGHEVQMKSVHNGYNQNIEDALLDSVAWEDDGYRLFEISVLAGSSAKGWFEMPAETNALFMKKWLWQELEGYDERFRSAGGGLANLDTWYRACHYPGADVLMLLGEGTFHQVHGGVATNASVSRWGEFDAEHLEIRGRPFERPNAAFNVFGELKPVHKAALRASVPSV